MSILLSGLVIGEFRQSPILIKQQARKLWDGLHMHQALQQLKGMSHWCALHCASVPAMKQRPAGSL